MNLSHNVAVPVRNNTHDQHVPTDSLMHSVVWEKVPEASSVTVFLLAAACVNTLEDLHQIITMRFGAF